MKDENKTKEQLINELTELRHRVSELEASEEQYKQTEIKLKKTKQEKKIILDTISVLIVHQDAEHKVLWANRAAGKSVNSHPGELVGRYCYEIWQRRNKPCVGCPVEKALKTGKPQKAKINFTDGRAWLIRGYPVRDANDNVVSVLEAAADITEFKRAKDALRESEEKYRTIFETTGTATIIIEEDTTISLVNTEFEKLTGYSKEELEGKKSWTEFVAKDDLERMKEYRRLRRIDPSTAPRNYEFRAIDKKGNIKDVFTTVAMIPGTKKSVASFLDITKRKQLEDELKKYSDRLEELVEERTNELKTTNEKLQQEIAERKRTEEELRNNELFLSNIFKSIQHRLTIIDDKFNIIRVNPQVEKSYPHALPLVGKKCHKVYHGRNERCKRCPAIIALKKGEVAHAAVPLNDADGNVTGWLDRYYYPFIDMATGQIKGVIISACDITEKMKVEQEMARLERLNLIGEMAAGIGHEVRNPMTAVRGFLQMLESKKEFNNYKKYFDTMIEELDRANSIITEFLSLAKTKASDLQVQNLNNIVMALFPLIQADATASDKNINVELGKTPDLLLGEKEIRQLILNLVRNGLEAMSPGGNLAIKTFTDGEEVVLSVQDEGKGIEPDILEKIYIPFFTTKEQGTGLGLAICYSIAARHNATIEVKTSSTGTIFFVRFKLQQS